MSKADVIYLREKLRKEVVEDHPTNADTILLRMYRDGIMRAYCSICIAICEDEDGSCWWPENPVQTSIIDTS